MKHYIVEDSSFIVAIMDKNDAFHNDAVFIFTKMSKNKNKIRVIVPPLVLYEVIVTLSRKGIQHAEIEEKILRLIHLKEVIVLSITETMAFKHCKNLLGVISKDPRFALRTADFMIASLAMDYDAQILTFDEKIRKRVKPVYNKVYYCSDLCKSVNNDTDDFLSDFSNEISFE